MVRFQLCCCFISTPPWRNCPHPRPSPDSLLEGEGASVCRTRWEKGGWRAVVHGLQAQRLVCGARGGSVHVPLRYRSDTAGQCPTHLRVGVTSTRRAL